MYIYIYISHLVSSSADGHLGCLHSLTVAYYAAMNIGVHTFFQISVFIFFGRLLRNGIAESNGRSVFNFLRNVYTASWWLHQSTFPPTMN